MEAEGSSENSRRWVGRERERKPTKVAEAFSEEVRGVPLQSTPESRECFFCVPSDVAAAVRWAFASFFCAQFALWFSLSWFQQCSQVRWWLLEGSRHLHQGLVHFLVEDALSVSIGRIVQPCLSLQAKRVPNHMMISNYFYLWKCHSGGELWELDLGPVNMGPVRPHIGPNPGPVGSVQSGPRSDRSRTESWTV